MPTYGEQNDAVHVAALAAALLPAVEQRVAHGTDVWTAMRETVEGARDRLGWTNRYAMLVHDALSAAYLRKHP